MSSHEPLISIVMPAYNIADYIADSIRSALAQTLHEFELIVIDDCSTDDTLDTVETLAASDSRIRILRTEHNLGCAGASNVGLQHARGRYVAFLDGDDLWATEKLAHQLEMLERTGAQLCYTAIQKIDVNGKPFGHVQSVPESVTYDELLGNPLIGCSTVLLDYEAVGRPLMSDICKRQDFAFWLLLLRNGARAVGINEPLMYYRVRSGSLSSDKLGAAHYVWCVYREQERLPLYRAVPKFIAYAVRGVGKRLNR